MHDAVLEFDAGKACGLSISQMKKTISAVDADVKIDMSLSRQVSDRSETGFHEIGFAARLQDDTVISLKDSRHQTIAG